MASLLRGRKEALAGLTLWLLLTNYQLKEFLNAKEDTQNSKILSSIYWKKKELVKMILIPAETQYNVVKNTLQITDYMQKKLMKKKQSKL